MKTFYFIILCASAVFSQSLLWELKQSGSSLGNPIITDPFNPRVVYYGSNSQVFKSVNRGESFTALGSAIPNATKIKNLIVSKKDNKVIVVAVKGSASDQILKSTDGGATWSVTATGLTFSYFGIPVTPDPSHQDTLYTMSANNFMKSVDFGSTWTTISTPSNFNAPCDIEVFPDSSNIILVGDNTTGIFKSTDYGVTWQTKFQTSGEIPTIAINKNRPGYCFATRWGGGGGLLKSTDYGSTWEALPFFAGKNMWGIDIAPDNPKMVLAGMYSGGTIYVSYDGGETWRGSAIAGSNYSVYIVDMRTIFAAQSTGFYKLRDLYGARPLVKSLTGNASGDGCTVKWQFTSDAGIKQFGLQQSTDGIRFTTVTQPVQYTEGADGRQYVVSIPSGGNGTGFFRVSMIDGDGNDAVSDVVQIEKKPRETRLEASTFPNPFNPATTISYSLPSSGSVRVLLFDALGRQIREIVNEHSAAGLHSTELSMNGFASGLYYYTLQFRGDDGSASTATHKLILQK